MWATIGNSLLKFLLIPLIKKAAVALFNYAKRKLAARKLKKENIKKGKAHEDSNVDDAIDTFNELP